MVLRPPREMGALEAARAIEAGTLTSEALVRSCLERIEARDGALHAFTAVDAQAALRAARAADAGPRRGLLHGLPFAAKDLIDTAELPTAYGSPIYRGHRPRADAACVALAGEQGAVLLGKVATSEFATQTPGATRNPLDLDRTPGGSSSGSAAAVADHMVAVAFGTQTTGSIIRPASYCGIVGYKPTAGLISPAGVKALSPSQDTVGLLAREVADAAFFAFGLHGHAVALACDAPLRIAVCSSRQWAHASAAMVEAVERCALALERAGARLQRIELAPELEVVFELQPAIVAFEARQALAFERLHAAGALSERLSARLAFGAQISPQEYLSMRQAVERARERFAEQFAQFDALLYPAADGEAEVGLDASGSPRFGALWTVLHLPCVCFPAARGPSGLPLGVQMVGRLGDDLRVLAAAEAARRALGDAARPEAAHAA
ncbi:amidase [Ramlibacter sp. AN1015]|uniref:amidase n=1 Tax=Ramlibacter sp. AN1015 TaxID=3133428 RepID=UPI0030BEB0DE